MFQGLQVEQGPDMFLSACVSALLSKQGLRGGLGDGTMGIWAGLGGGPQPRCEPLTVYK